MCRVPLYNIFPHYLINGTIFEKKKLLNIKCVLIFSTKLVWNNFYSKRNWTRYDKKYIGLHGKYPLFLSYFIETWIFSIVSKNTQISKYRENPSSVTPVVPRRQLDETNSRFSQHCSRDYEAFTVNLLSTFHEVAALGTNVWRSYNICDWVLSFNGLCQVSCWRRLLQTDVLLRVNLPF